MLAWPKKRDNGEKSWPAYEEFKDFHERLAESL